MHLTKVKHLLVLAGLLAAGPAWAGTLTVYPTMIGPQAAASATDPKYGAFYAVAQVVGGAIDCPTNYTAGMAGKSCVAEVTGSVALVASPVSNAVAVAWAGCPAGGLSTTTVANDTCTLTMGANPQTVEATFKPELYPLALATFGPPGYAGVLTTAAGACQTGAVAPNNVCAQSGTNGTVIPVVAIPGAGNKTTWTGCTVDLVGDPTGNTCLVALTSPKGVSATFGPVGIPVTVQFSSYGGTGTVVAPLGGDVVDAISCLGDCTGQVNPGGAITLVATATGGSKFYGFTGCGATPTTVTQTCVMTNVTAAKNVTATFKSGASCNACHDVPPASHGADWTVVNDCSACHGGTGSTPPGYTAGSVNPNLHMNGAKNIVTVPTAAPTASLKLTVFSASIPTDGTTRPSVTFDVTDDAGNPLVIGSAAGNVGNPTFLIGKLEANGTYVSYASRGRTGLAYPLVPGTPNDTLPVIRNWTGDVSSSPTGSSASTCTVGTAGCARQDTNDTFAASRLVAVAGTPGRYRYTFSTAWTIADPAQLHTIALYATRVVSGYNFRAAASIDLAPNGTPVTERQVVSDAACNACHGELTLHGSRRGVKSCLICHNPGTIDPESGNDVDLATMVHKIHNGALLADRYHIVGNSQNNYEYNHILMAPSHSGYFESTNTAVHDPGLSRECSICHDGTSAAQAGNAFSNPSRRACGSCHDTVDFATGVGHDGPMGGPQADDSACAGCHSVATTSLFHSRFFEPLTQTDFSALPSMPAEGHVFTVDLVGISVDANGRPTFTLDAKLDGNPFDMAAAATVTSGSAAIVTTNDPLGGRLPTCSFLVAGPTSDYTFPATGSAQVSCTAIVTSFGPTSVLLLPVLDGGGAAIPGRFSVTQPAQTCNATTGACTATTPVFRGASAGLLKTGAWSVSYEMMYQRQTLTGADQVRKPFAANPKFYTLVNTGTAAAPVWLGTGGGADPLIVRGSGTADDLAYSRRAVVTFDKCNACHVDLGFHSNRGRKGPDYCAMCHSPKLDNGTRARVTVAEAGFIPGTTQLGYLPESVSMNAFIHRIHMGSALPSVKGTEIGRSTAAIASPWVPNAGEIIYGATRSAFTGVAAGSPAVEVGPPERADFTEFLMPNTMNRCEQCHIDVGAQQTWALPDAAGKAPVERTWKVCNTLTPRPAWATEDWCNAAASNSSGMPKYTGPGALVVTPPLKASCTSCHDSAATDAHADLYTTNPMTAGATELCASCHGPGKTFDSILVHRPVP